MGAEAAAGAEVAAGVAAVVAAVAAGVSAVVVAAAAVWGRKRQQGQRWQQECRR